MNFFVGGGYAAMYVQVPMAVQTMESNEMMIAISVVIKMIFVVLVYYFNSTLQKYMISSLLPNICARK